MTPFHCTVSVKNLVECWLQRVQYLLLCDAVGCTFHVVTQCVCDVVWRFTAGSVTWCRWRSHSPVATCFGRVPGARWWVVWPHFCFEGWPAPSRAFSAPSASSHADHLNWLIAKGLVCTAYTLFSTPTHIMELWVFMLDLNLLSHSHGIHIF